MIQFEGHIFSKGLVQPPTSSLFKAGQAYFLLKVFGVWFRFGVFQVHEQYEHDFKNLV